MKCIGARRSSAIRAPVPDDFVFACCAVGVVEDVNVEGGDLNDLNASFFDRLR